MIHTNPTGATVKSYGKTLGTTPLKITSKQASLTVRQLTLEKEGFLPSTLVIQRSEWDTSGVVILSLVCPPALWFVADYPPQYAVDLVPAANMLSTTAASVATAAPTPKPVGFDDPAPVSSDSLWYRYHVGGQIKVTLDDGTIIRGWLVYKAGDSIVVKTDHGQQTFVREHIKSVSGW